MEDELTFENEPTIYSQSLFNSEIIRLKISYSIPHGQKFLLSSIYFTVPSLKESHRHLPKPKNISKPTFPSFTTFFCCNDNKEEKIKSLDTYFMDLKNQYLFRGRFDKLFKSLDFPLISDPLAPLTEIKTLLETRHNIETKVPNLLTINLPHKNILKKPIIKIAGTKLVLFDHGALNDGGGFATVHKYGIDKECEPEFCIKKYPINPINVDNVDIEAKKNKEKFKKRVEALKQCISEYTVWASNLKHPNIIRYYEFMNQKDKVTGSIKYICILMKYCNKGSLKKYLSNRVEGWTEEEAEKYFIQILSGYKYLQSQKPPIFHGDIKPENIFVHEIKGKLTLKLADFGYAQRIFKEKYASQFRNPSSSLPYCAPQLLKTIPIEWNEKDMQHASDILTTQPYSPKSDIWSLGVVLFEMIYRKSPWGQNCSEENNRSQIKDFLLEHLESDEPEIFYPRPLQSGKLREAIRGMLMKNEKDRWDFDQLFKNFGINQEKNMKKPHPKASGPPKATSHKELDIKIPLDHFSMPKAHENRSFTVTDFFSSRSSLDEQRSLMRKTSCFLFPEMVEVSSKSNTVNSEDSKSNKKTIEGEAAINERTISENKRSKISEFNKYSENSKISENSKTSEESKINSNAFNSHLTIEKSLNEFEDELEIPNESFIAQEIEFKKDLYKCSRFTIFINRLCGKLKEHYPDESETLIFILSKWKFAIFLPVIRRILKKNQANPNVRSIKWKALEILSKNQGMPASQKVFNELKSWNDSLLELLSDTIPEKPIFYQKTCDLIKSIRDKIKSELDDPDRREIENLKDKLSIYYRICILLSAQNFFDLGEDFNNPFDCKKLETRLKMISFEDFLKELKI